MDINNTLIQAVKSNDIKKVKAYLKRKKKNDNNYNDAINLAAGYGYVDIFILLLPYGFDPRTMYGYIQWGKNSPNYSEIVKIIQFYLQQKHKIAMEYDLDD